MIRRVALSCVLLTVAVSSAWAQSLAPIVFFDIAAPDSPKLQQFYADLFGWTATPAGTFSAPWSCPAP
jgi:predicted enzyme related to lactoylglutathione lyase